MGNISDKNRIWELDFVRGIALILMVYFHVVYDLREIYGYSVSYAGGINYFIGKASVILFMFVSGISCSLSKNNLKRGLRILAAAAVITLASWAYNADLIILFGVLHFFGVCLIMAPLISRLNEYVLLGLGTAVIMLQFLIPHIKTGNDWLMPIGIHSPGFTSSDYYPLIPWLGIFLYGLAAGKLFYRAKKSIFSFRLKDNIVSRAGRNTLLLYILHQPVIIGTLMLLERMGIISGK
ncbi:putative membrane protein [Anaerobacterium chartisolvens]|uniref:Putative membrane protein n=1 Tax=Anaerobacterium chartisolvens TaxID=1297424 RepID=A0A369AVQ9_9FIRM|nr:heparan-alpha-glucosaminide N-acetyltransferase [Anaerobacterium chartisolvens]RCX13472.1 putative membrane protein [Anaerobacterium chartisolvens]